MEQPEARAAFSGPRLVLEDVGAAEAQEEGGDLAEVAEEDLEAVVVVGTEDPQEHLSDECIVFELCLILTPQGGSATCARVFSIYK